MGVLSLKIDGVFWCIKTLFNHQSINWHVAVFESVGDECANP